MFLAAGSRQSLLLRSVVVSEEDEICHSLSEASHAATIRVRLHALKNK